MANRINGTWIRISEEVYGLLQTFLKADVDCPDEAIEFSNKEDKLYFEKIIEEMHRCSMLADGKKYLEQEKSNMVIFETTNRCNLHCAHCCMSAGDLEAKEFDTNTMIQILDKCIEWKPHFIALSGGEPLLRKDFFEILQYLRQHFSGKIGICTNATLITEDNAGMICTNVDQLDISIDGVDEETCSLYRGKGVFKKVVNAIKLLQSKGFYNISLSMVFSDKNEILEHAFKQLNESLGTKPVYRMLAEKGRAKENKEVLATKNYEASYVPKSFIEDMSDDTPLGASECMAGNHSILIRYNGDIYPCPSFVSYNELCMGNICKIDDINKIVGKNMHLLIKEKLYKANRANSKACQDCPVKLFCFSCPGDPERFSAEESFQKYCSISKPVLMNRVWGV
ncbi:MAG: radical SAM protein [Eubacterium sp.]|nr:radical SAM protein [Eubacterium sp.]